MGACVGHGEGMWGGRSLFSVALAKKLKLKEINDSFPPVLSSGLKRKYSMHVSCGDLIFIFTTAQKRLDYYFTMRKPNLKEIKY